MNELLIEDLLAPPFGAIALILRASGQFDNLLLSPRHLSFSHNPQLLFRTSYLELHHIHIALPNLRLVLVIPQIDGELILLLPVNRYEQCCEVILTLWSAPPPRYW